MKFLFRRRQAGAPCRHMEGVLNRVAGGKAGRFARWYALAHAARCGPCRRFLAGLENMLDQLKTLKGPNPDAATMERLMQAIEPSESGG